MDLLVILLVVLVLGNVATIYLLYMRSQQGATPQDTQGLMLLQNSIQDLARTLDSRVAESSKQMNESVRSQLGESARLIKDVTEGLTKLDETNRQVVSFADQLQSLQDILKNPKQRGILGEYYLETLLKNVMPPGSYQMQYPFAGGDIVDAAVFVKDKIIPIDSKFSLDNYNKLVVEKEPTERARLEKVFVNDLKNRIVETSKYILPAEGTMDFAFMFIPHEAIYYDLLMNSVGALKDEEENLIQRAASKYKVIIVSPTSFLAYLQTVLQGLRGMEIEEKAKEIQKWVGELSKHLKAYEEYQVGLGAALGTVVNKYNFTSKEFKKIDKDVYKISGVAAGLDSPLLEKPSLDE
jgi:DNA recombination protein RmuC